MPPPFTTRVSAPLMCLADPNCSATQASKPKSEGLGAYPLTFLALRSDLRAMSEGVGKLDIILVVRNSTKEDFGPFSTIVSPAVVRQGQPVDDVPIYHLSIEGLGAGQTGEFAARDLDFPLPGDGLITCFDPKFRPQTP